MRNLLIVLLLSIFLLISIQPASSAEKEYYNREGFLVVGMTTDNLTAISKEYDLVKNQGFIHVHIRDGRYWANKISAEKYSLVYDVFSDRGKALEYSEYLKASGKQNYVTYSGRQTHGPFGFSGYFVIGLCTTDKNEVLQEFEKNKDAKLADMAVCFSTSYEGFVPGYYIVIYGVFNSVAEATNYAKYIQDNGIDVYVKYGAWKG